MSLERVSRNLTKLEFRKAYIMIKGVLEYPILFGTLDTPLSSREPFECSGMYTSIKKFERIYKDRKQAIE